MLNSISRFSLFAFLSLFVQAPAFAITLSDSAQITLLTCAPGQELYSCFGHTGIRVTDYKQGFDVVFNYGTFDFEKPGFYTNFVKGHMIYMEDVDRFENFRSQYIYEERGIIEQVLYLSTEEKQKIFAFLDSNALPQNRDYRYDFFWDNCSTRPRDLFEKILGSRFQYDYSGFDSTKTMHDLLREYVHERPWVDFGFDLILGVPCETKAKPRYQMFLPDYLSKAFGQANIDGKPFVVSTETILEFPLYKNPTPTISPIILTCTILFLFLITSFIEFKKQRHYHIADFIWTFGFGLFGTFFLSLWLFTEHFSVKENLNMLWLLPAHLPISFLLLWKNKPKWLGKYFLFSMILSLLLIVGWKFNPQPYNTAVLPLLVLIIIRSFSLYKSIAND